VSALVGGNAALEPAPLGAHESPSAIVARLAKYAQAMGWEVVRDSHLQTNCRRWNAAGTHTQWILLYGSDRTWQRDPSFSVAAETRSASGRFLQGGPMRATTWSLLFSDVVRTLGTPRS